MHIRCLSQNTYIKEAVSHLSEKGTSQRTARATLLIIDTDSVVNHQELKAIFPPVYFCIIFCRRPVKQFLRQITFTFPVIYVPSSVSVSRLERVLSSIHNNYLNQIAFINFRPPSQSVKLTRKEKIVLKHVFYTSPGSNEFIHNASMPQKVFSRHKRSLFEKTGLRYDIPSLRISVFKKTMEKYMVSRK